MDEWRCIFEYENYQVSNKGRVRSINRYIQCSNGVVRHVDERELTPSSNKGYLEVCLYKDGQAATKQIHRLVAAAFLPNPQNLAEVDHIDGNKQNNRVENLRWISHVDNIAAAKNNGQLNTEFWLKSIQKSNSKPVKDLVSGKSYSSMQEAALDTGLHSDSISNSIRQNRTVKGHKFIFIDKF